MDTQNRIQYPSDCQLRESKLGGKRNKCPCTRDNPLQCSVQALTVPAVLTWGSGRIREGTYSAWPNRRIGIGLRVVNGLGSTIRITLPDLETVVPLAKLLEQFSDHVRHALAVLFLFDLGAELLPTFSIGLLHSVGRSTLRRRMPVGLCPR